MDVDTDKLNAFMGKMVTDLGAAMNASLMLVGDKLGLYKTLAEKGPMNSSELAKATGTTERYVREWLAAQAASGYIEYDAASGKFSMTPEQNMIFGDEDSPVFVPRPFFIGEEFWEYAETPIHWDCFAHWEKRPEFARRYFQANAEGAEHNQFWGVARRDEQRPSGDHRRGL